MCNSLETIINRYLTGSEITHKEHIQTLWSGYGEILRVYLQGGPFASVILKHIRLPSDANHPRGWNTGLSHQRKLKSYRVETHWYRNYAQHCGPLCPVPQCLGVKSSDNETFLLLSDLSAGGYSDIKTQVTLEDVHACLSWLAHFHATNMHQPAKGLWDCGTYWHLDTRPDELQALEDKPLQQAATAIDQALKQCTYQTLVHGDAKLANFCFAPTNTAANNKSAVAAVDFQYVGAGCGMKDVAYFLGSCLSENDCEQLEAPLLDYYFNVLQFALNKNQPQIDGAKLEREWRALFDVAWADFHRFLKGWSPGHWKLNSYSEKLTRRVIQRLNAQTVAKP